MSARAAVASQVDALLEAAAGQLLTQIAAAGYAVRPAGDEE